MKKSLLIICITSSINLLSNPIDDLINKFSTDLRDKLNTEFNSSIKNINIKEELLKTVTKDKNSYEIHNNKDNAQEAEAIKNRKNSSKQTLEFLGLNPNLNIGLCASGGGYRAMIYTLGAIEAARRTGLHDAALYFSTLSGSTWALNGLLLSPSLENFVTKLKANLNENKKFGNLGTPIPENVTEIKDSNTFIKNLATKIIFEQPISSVDLWGAIITGNVLEKQSYKISDEENSTKSGKNILPIYTAVNPTFDSGFALAQYDRKDKYDWYEFTPFEVKNLTTNSAVPIQAFGRKLDNNKTINFAPELPLSFYMGTFGSAYTASIEELEHISKLFENLNIQIKKELKENILQKLDSNKIIYNLKNELKLQKGALLNNLPNKIGILTVPKSTIDNNLNEYIEQKFNTSQINIIIDNQIDGLIDDTTKDLKIKFDSLPGNVKGYRFLPANVLNPFYSNTDNKKEITLVDAGIDINLPIKPLLKPHREVDAIFVFDASDSTENAPELKKAIEGFNINIKDIDYKKVGEEPVSFLENKNDIHTPLIIYLPLLKSPLLEESLEIIKQNVDIKNNFSDEELNELKMLNMQEAKNTFLSTFNFVYTNQEFDQLKNIAKFNLLSNLNGIKKRLKDRVIRNNLKIKKSNLKRIK